MCASDLKCSASSSNSAEAPASASTARPHVRELLCRFAKPTTTRKPSPCNTQYNGSLYHRDYVCGPRESRVAGCIQLWLYSRRDSRQVPARVLADSALTTLTLRRTPRDPTTTLLLRAVPPRCRLCRPRDAAGSDPRTMLGASIARSVGGPWRGGVSLVEEAATVVSAPT